MNNKHEILESIWSEFDLSLTQVNHPFHIFSISTIQDNKPDSRYVVLRNVDKKNYTISFNSDKRASKIMQIKNNKNVCALFYDIKKKVQIRIYGNVKIENDIDIIKNTWDQLQKMSKLCYLNIYAPGIKLKNSKDYLPKDFDGKGELGLTNFSILRIKINLIDWLNLNHRGHERFIYDVIQNKINWVAP